MNNIDWLHSLEQKGVLNTLFVDEKSFYRISTLAKFIISSELINYIGDEYEAGKEKGGLILFEPSILDSTPHFIAKEVVFITNTAEQYWRQYRPHQSEKDLGIENAFDQKLLPFNFHTHPTKSQNILFESQRFLDQLNTSDADQMCSLRSIDVDDIRLRLPDILIVGNGSECLNLFIGFYNGLICSTSFTEHKNKLSNNASSNTIDWIENALDTDEKKFGAAVLAILAVFLICRYPKVAIPLLLTSVVVIPQMIYSFQLENNFFGISNGNELQIAIPKVDDKIVIQNELDAKMKLEKYYEEQRGNRKLLTQPV